MATATSSTPLSKSEFSPFPSRRSVVHSTNGIVACSQPLACQAGIRILQDGGNCADAAVAVAAVLALTEPAQTGIGGDMFALFYDADAKKVRALNGSGWSVAGASLESVRRELGLKDGENDSIPVTSVHAVTRPGAAGGWVDVVEKFGSGTMTLERILAPAIKLAEEGFPVSAVSSSFWFECEAAIRAASPNFREILKADPHGLDGCRCPRSGEIFTNKNLAETFRRLGRYGKKGFYEGRIAEAMVKVVRDLGGHLTLDDLKEQGECGCEEVDPISIKFNGQAVARKLERHSDNTGLEIWECPPNGQGIIALMALGIMEELERAGQIPIFTRDQHNSAEYLHAVIESLRIAFADGTWLVTDPASTPVSSASVLDKNYLAERARLFSPTARNPSLRHGSPAQNASDTVLFVCTDSRGNGISFINSNNSGFGTAIIPPSTGFPLQSRGSNFSLRATHPNVFAPRKRPYHTIIPALTTYRPSHSASSTSCLHAVFGVMGGFMQPQGHVQLLLNIAAFGLSPQAAVDAPRVCVRVEGADVGRAVTALAAHDDGDGGIVDVEEGVSDQAIEGLRQRGHVVRVVSGWERSVFGRGQVICVREEAEEEGGVIADGNESGNTNGNGNEMGDGKRNAQGEQVQRNVRRIYSAGSDGRGDGQAVGY